MQKVPRRGVIPHATVIPIVLTVLHSGTKYTTNKLLTGADRSMRNISDDLVSERERGQSGAQLRAITLRSHARSLSLGPKIHALEKCFFVAGMKISAHDFPYRRSVFLWQRAESHTLAQTRRNVENNDVEKRKIASTVRCVSRRRMRFC